MVEDSMHSPRYVRNPDVVLREEDPDGALLFNPDTNQIRVVNITGLFIWRLCDGSHDVAGLARAVKQAFDQVPEGEVIGQVEAYVEDMAAAGFLGTVVE